MTIKDYLSRSWSYMTGRHLKSVSIELVTHRSHSAYSPLLIPLEDERQKGLPKAFLKIRDRKGREMRLSLRDILDQCDPRKNNDEEIYQRMGEILANSGDLLDIRDITLRRDSGEDPIMDWNDVKIEANLK